MVVNWMHVLGIVFWNMVGIGIGCSLWFGAKYIIKEWRIFMREERKERNARMREEEPC